MSIVTNKNRVGRFTSSKIHCLMSKGKSAEFTVAGYTYIAERRHERKLGRSLDTDGYSRDSAWGLFLESYVFQNYTEINCEFLGDETTINPKINCHAGSTDLLVPEVKVSDVKCYQLRKFCRIAECFIKRDLSVFRREFKEEYWQLVSNALIHDVSRAESIIYCPSEANLKDIRDQAADYQGADQWKYRFIYESKDHQLAYIPDGSEYDSIYKLEFDIPIEDTELLIERLGLAEQELIKLGK